MSCLLECDLRSSVKERAKAKEKKLIQTSGRCRLVSPSFPGPVHTRWKGPAGRAGHGERGWRGSSADSGGYWRRWLAPGTHSAARMLRLGCRRLRLVHHRLLRRLRLLRLDRFNWRWHLLCLLSISLLSLARSLGALQLSLALLLARLRGRKEGMSRSRSLRGRHLF